MTDDDEMAGCERHIFTVLWTCPFTGLPNDERRIMVTSKVFLYKAAVHDPSPCRYMLHPGCTIYHASDLWCLWFGASRPRCLHHASFWVSRWKPRAALVEFIVYDARFNISLFAYLLPYWPAGDANKLYAAASWGACFLAAPAGLCFDALGPAWSCPYYPYALCLMLRLSPNSIMEHCWNKPWAHE